MATSCNLLPALNSSKSYLDDKVPASEICNSPRESGPAPYKTKKKRTFRVGERFHHLPEPLDKGSGGLNPFIGGYRFQKVQRNIWTPTDLKDKIKKESRS